VGGEMSGVFYGDKMSFQSSLKWKNKRVAKTKATL